MTANDKCLERYPVPAAENGNPFISRLEIRKSVFVTRTMRCRNAGEARAIVSNVRQLHPDASHNCWAFVAGPPGNTACIGFSDDGEPHGTAGKPILNVLLHSGIGQICSVVSRWFGGIKLGTGGLSRAYQGAVSENIAGLPLLVCAPRLIFKVFLEYSLLDAFRRLLSDVEAELLQEEYGKNVKFLFSIPEDRVKEAQTRIRELSSGRVQLEQSAFDTCLN